MYMYILRGVGEDEKKIFEEEMRLSSFFISLSLFYFFLFIVFRSVLVAEKRRATFRAGGLDESSSLIVYEVEEKERKKDRKRMKERNRG
ncbi:hypothetical protein CSUI_010405 [Cystoisospora suis]|uniref:Transmembrane protein n=1 Tax=Cystoisospora suis TaxID=483139 RepID=A0A2C6KHA8_9APIC|nr:hypothetical protein CSUI_010405 [Cystoisospora suis]